MFGELAQAIRCKGLLTVEVEDAVTGKVLERHQYKNLVVTAGRNLLRDLLNDSSPAGLTHFGIGTGTTAVAASDTALVAEITPRATVTSKTTDSAKLTVKYYLPSGTANGNTITEAGVFNASSGPTMYARVVLASSIVKTSAIAVTFQWDFTWST